MVDLFQSIAPTDRARPAVALSDRPGTWIEWSRLYESVTGTGFNPASTIKLLNPIFGGFDAILVLH
jgi:hypothetical protein